jgi:hypothetical protein
MQQGLTRRFYGHFPQKIPLKIKGWKSTLKVTYQELIDVKTRSSTGMPAW